MVIWYIVWGFMAREHTVVGHMGEETAHCMAPENKEKERDQGSNIPFKDIPPVT
jgi:hypothetical protein